MKTLLLILLFGCTMYAQTSKISDKWEYYGTTSGTAAEKAYWNGDMDGDIAGKLLWFKFVPVDRAAFIAKYKLPKSYAYSLRLIYFHCGAKRAGTRKLVQYGLKDDPLKTVEASYESSLTPGTLLADIYEAACPAG